jgi:hypothetical protein
VARWNPSKHPRDRNGKFKGNGGGSGKVSLVGQGRSLRYSRTPTRGEVAATLATSAGRGAAVGFTLGGPKGAAIGGALGGANAGAKVLVLSRRTAKAAKLKR